MKSAALLLENSLLGIWNNRNPEERLSLMKTIYAPEIHFYESDGGNAIIGFGQINNLITNLQSEWAPDFIFTLSKPSQSNHGVQVISWTLGMPHETPVASGMDVAVVEDEKIKSLYLYLD